MIEPQYIQYKPHIFRKQSSLTIEQANSIITEYRNQGYLLTLRQLYYQFVARDIIPNSKSEYDKLGVTISKGRLAGLIDWESIVDRTRTANQNNHFKSPEDILTAAAETYKLDTRADQDVYIEVWIEKEALIGVIEPACLHLDVMYLACRGYYSQTAMYQASRRIRDKESDGKKAVIIHLGDHDPSGIDMTRDNKDRLALFNTGAQVERIALNMDQVEQYNPPPNYIKESFKDNRKKGYIEKYGDKSWELDAIEPKEIYRLITDAVNKHTDQDKRQTLIDLQAEHKDRLDYVAGHWKEIEG